MHNDDMCIYNIQIIFYFYNLLFLINSNLKLKKKKYLLFSHSLLLCCFSKYSESNRFLLLHILFNFSPSSSLFSSSFELSFALSTSSSSISSFSSSKISSNSGTVFCSMPKSDCKTIIFICIPL
jgi:hypothetical protein